MNFAEYEDSKYITFPEKDSSDPGNSMKAGNLDDSPLVEIGENFIASIRNVYNESSMDIPSRLNASSGLHVLSRRMPLASDTKSNSTSANNITGSSFKSDYHNVQEVGSIPTLHVEGSDKSLQRFVGGAAVMRINVLIYLNQLLDEQTRGHKNAANIKASIRQGTDINAKNKASRTAICVAAENGRLDSVTALIAAKADIEVTDQEDQSVLHSAAKAGNAELVRALVNSKADLDALNKENKKPFDLATNEECKYALKKMGAGDWTTLMVAAERGDNWVERYFYLRDCFVSMTRTWTWGITCQDIGFSDDSKSCSKEEDGFSSTLGSEEFVGWGVHMWTVSVSEHKKLWAGVARGSSLSRMDLSPEKCEFDLMAVVSSNGDIVEKGHVQALTKQLDGPIFSFDDSSSHAISFKLDMQRQTLEISVGSKPAFLIFKLGEHDCNRVRPYVCLEGPGKFALHSQVTKFPSAFQDDVRFYSSLVKKESLWGWGVFNREEIILHDLVIIKQSSSNNKFACAAGNEEFAKGVHSWKISVDREDKEHKMFVGVCRGIPKREDLVLPPDRMNLDFVFVLCSDGEGKCYSKDAMLCTVTMNDSREWPEHQDITLKLDMHKQTLEIFASNRLTCTVSELDGRGLRPYVCIEGIGSVSLESGESLVMNSNSSMVSFKDRAVGLDNAEWDDPELNKALLALPMAGEISRVVYAQLLLIPVFHLYFI